MSFPICPVCTFPVRRRGRTMHVSCAEADAGRPTLRFREHPAPGQVHECCFCMSTDTSEKDGGWFCEKHYPYDERATVQQRTLTATPERCDGCGEAVTPKVTSTSIKCKCEQPKMPRHLRNNDSDDRPPMQVRYGN